MDRADAGYAGYKDYGTFMLAIYDRWVLGFMAPRVWKVGSEPGVAAYRSHMGARHLEVGPGSGWFLTQVEPPTRRLTLVDPNPQVLGHCARVLATAGPELVQANVLHPLPVDGPFDSAALMHVLHCLPGPMAARADAIRNVADLLTDDGVLFGGTVLGIAASGHGPAARTFLRLANRQGGFDNLADDVAGLTSVLERSFTDVEVDGSGSIAYFVARHPRRDR